MLPRRALTAAQVTLVHATRMNLELLAAEPDVSRLIARVRRRKRVELIEPSLLQTPDGWKVLMPGETA